mgnify:CR=1 FL=1
MLNIYDCRCVAAYASDYRFLQISLRPHRGAVGHQTLSLSLDHSYVATICYQRIILGRFLLTFAYMNIVNFLTFAFLSILIFFIEYVIPLRCYSISDIVKKKERICDTPECFIVFSCIATTPPMSDTIGQCTMGFNLENSCVKRCITLSCKMAMALIPIHIKG